MSFPVPRKSSYARMDDERLAALAGTGDAAAFEALYDRHHAALLAFCRHMLGNREDGEDALQQAFVRAHRALTGGRAPDRVRPWLFAIARNRCLTLISARREAALPADDLEPSFDGLAADVQRRADLRELVTDLARLPDDQREALVLAELGDFSHTDIARVVGCAPDKVKALVFQARTTLIADRDARRTPCEEIRSLLDTARGGLLRRGSLRRHLRQCDPCAAYRVAVERQRAGLARRAPRRADGRAQGRRARGRRRAGRRRRRVRGGGGGRHGRGRAGHAGGARRRRRRGEGAGRQGGARGDDRRAAAAPRSRTASTASPRAPRRPRRRPRSPGRRAVARSRAVAGTAGRAGRRRRGPGRRGRPGGR